MVNVLPFPSVLSAEMRPPCAHLRTFAAKAPRFRFPSTAAEPQACGRIVAHMLKVFAFIVIAFFVALYASGNNVQSIKHSVNHWADANSQLTGGNQGDWGTT